MTLHVGGRYLDIVLAFVGDSTIINVFLDGSATTSPS